MSIQAGASSAAASAMPHRAAGVASRQAAVANSAAVSNGRAALLPRPGSSGCRSGCGCAMRRRRALVFLAQARSSARGAPCPAGQRRRPPAQQGGQRHGCGRALLEVPATYRPRPWSMHGCSLPEACGRRIIPAARGSSSNRPERPAACRYRTRREVRRIAVAIHHDFRTSHALAHLALRRVVPPRSILTAVALAALAGCAQMRGPGLLRPAAESSETERSTRPGRGLPHSAVRALATCADRAEPRRAWRGATPPRRAPIPRPISHSAPLPAARTPRTSAAAGEAANTTAAPTRAARFIAAGADLRGHLPA